MLDVQNRKIHTKSTYRKICITQVIITQVSSISKVLISTNLSSKALNLFKIYSKSYRKFNISIIKLNNIIIKLKQI